MSDEKCEYCGKLGFFMGTCCKCGKSLCYDCSLWYPPWKGATNERYCKECYSNLYTCKKCDLVKTKDEMGVYGDFCIHCIENHENEDKN